MDILWLNANIFWAILFFGLSLAAGGVMMVKLEGRWRAVPPITALLVAAGVGFSLMGQYWMDRMRIRASILDDLPLEHSRLRRTLVEEARHWALDRAPDAGADGPGDLVLDTVDLQQWVPEKGTKIVTVSFLPPPGSPVDRVYVRMAHDPSAPYRIPWRATSVFVKKRKAREVSEAPLGARRPRK